MKILELLFLFDRKSCQSSTWHVFGVSKSGGGHLKIVQNDGQVRAADFRVYNLLGQQILAKSLLGQPLSGGFRVDFTRRGGGYLFLKTLGRTWGGLGEWKGVGELLVIGNAWVTMAHFVSPLG